MKLAKVDPGFVKAAVFGANDGIITTFAVVAGVAGAGLPPFIVIIMGVANMVADGISMAVGDFIGERSEQRLRRIQGESYKKKRLWMGGVITFVAFVLAGTMPLLPYFAQALGVPVPSERQFTISIIATATALFVVGSLRSIPLKSKWYRCGVEQLSIGAIAAVTAYGLGFAIEHFVDGQV